MSFDDDMADDFSRLHRLFVFHLGVAVGLAWMMALYAALYAPWVHNIRPLLDPANASRTESTGAFLFGLPVLLTLAWGAAIVGRDVFRHFRMMRNQAVEFGMAAAAAFIVFYLSIDRAVAALLLGV